MARPLRFEFKGVLYHVHARGNERKKIFFTDTDYQKFKDYKNKLALYLIKRHTGATNNEIGALFGGVSYSAVLKTYQRMLERLQTDRDLRKKIEKAESSMSNIKG